MQDEVNDLIAAHPETPTYEDLVELKSASEEEEEALDPEEDETGLAIEYLSPLKDNKEIAMEGGGMGSLYGLVFSI